VKLKKLKLLRLLQKRQDQWVVMEGLCRELGFEAEEIAKAAGELQEQGFQIEISPVSGYRYVASEEPLWDELLKVGGCKRLGRKIKVVQEARSTNDLARAAAKDRDNDGLAIFCEFQTAGRGRQGAQWFSPAGVNLLFSVLLFDEHKHFDPHLLTLAAGIALAQAVKQNVGVDGKLKWPNDLLLDGQKAGGILVEVFDSAVVVGMGLNCNCLRADLAEAVKVPAMSLREMAGHIIDRHSLAREILKHLDEWLGICLVDGRQQVREKYLELSDLLGQNVNISCDSRQYCGRVVELDPFKGILVQLDRGGVRLFTPASTSLVG